MPATVVVLAAPKISVIAPVTFSALVDEKFSTAAPVTVVVEAA